MLASISSLSSRFSVFSSRRWACALCVLVSALCVLASPSLAQQPTDLETARELLKSLSSAESAVAPIQPVGPSQVALARLAVLRARYLISAGSAADPASTKAAIDFARQEINRISHPAPSSDITGPQERAYISEIDGSSQPYLLYIPKSYKPDQKCPLIVFLHGYDPLISVINWRANQVPTALQDISEKEGAILLFPFGRSNTEFMGIGEKDVLDTIKFAEAEYKNIDPQRVLLFGISMGGSGALSIACHHPDHFAALVILTGRVDYYLWQGVPKESLPRFKQIQIDADYGRELLPNLGDMPIRLYHGDKDQAIQVEQSRLLCKLLSDLGKDVKYKEVPGADHYALGTADFLGDPALGELVRAARLNPEPERVSFRTLTIKYNKAFWVIIQGIREYGKMAEVLAEARKLVTSDNINGLYFGSVPGDKPEGLNKTPALCGPIREAFGGPFVIVYPAEKNDQTLPDLGNAARVVREWMDYAQGVPLCLTDSAITDEVIAKKNLILFGSPRTNTVFARMADKLPFRIEPDKYVVGEKSFPSAGNGFQAIYPNPLNPNRYVLVIHGAQWAPTVQINHKLDMLPDFIVYSSETEKDGTLYPTNRWLCAGYFDSNWKLSENSTWTRPADAEPQHNQ